MCIISIANTSVQQKYLVNFIHSFHARTYLFQPINTRAYNLSVDWPWVPSKVQVPKSHCYHWSLQVLWWLMRWRHMSTSYGWNKVDDQEVQDKKDNSLEKMFYLPESNQPELNFWFTHLRMQSLQKISNFFPVLYLCKFLMNPSLHFFSSPKTWDLCSLLLSSHTRLGSNYFLP